MREHTLMLAAAVAGAVLAITTGQPGLVVGFAAIAAYDGVRLAHIYRGSRDV